MHQAPANCRLTDEGSPWHPLINPYIPITGPIFHFLPDKCPWLTKPAGRKGRQMPERNPMGVVVALGPVFWSVVMDKHEQEISKAFVTLHYLPHPLGSSQYTRMLMVPVGTDRVYFPGGQDWRKFVTIPPKPSKGMKMYLPWL